MSKRLAVLDSLRTGFVRSRGAVLGGPRQCGKTTVAREFAFLFASLCSLVACNSDEEPSSCSLLHWTHVVTFALEPALAATGSYAFSVEGNGVAEACAVSFGNAMTGSCSVGLELADSDGNSTGGFLRDAENSDPLREIVQVRFVPEDAKPPETLELTIVTGNAEVPECYTVQPDYETDEPNGEGCGVRYSATVNITR